MNTAEQLRTSTERSQLPAWVTSAFAASEQQTQRFAGIETLRDSARLRVGELGLPTSKQEDWKYTNTAPITRGTFNSVVAPTTPQALNLQALTRFGISDLKGPRLVFINGIFSKELSALTEVPRGVTVESLAQVSQGTSANSSAQALLQSHFGKQAKGDEQAFVALNTALVQDGAFIAVADHARIEAPIVVLFVVTEEQRNIAVYPRMLVHLGKQSECSVVECYVGLTEEPYLTTAVTEVIVSEGACGNHYRLQLEGGQACHVSTTDIVQAQKSTFATHSFSFGGSLVRNDVNPTLDGEGIESTLNGLSVLNDKQHVDNHTVIDHAKPHSLSHELYKGIYAGASHGVFNGTIIVRKDAQKTNAIQSNQSLLLSDEAMIDAKPQLKIWADDVRCTHGATVGQLSDEALFYLRSRGIGATEAKHILIRAFASDLLEQISLEPLKDLLLHLIGEKLDLIERSAEVA